MTSQKKMYLQIKSRIANTSTLDKVASQRKQHLRLATGYLKDTKFNLPVSPSANSAIESVSLSGDGFFSLFKESLLRGTPPNLRN